MNEVIFGNLKRLAAALNAAMGPNGVILKACSVKALHIRLEVAEEIACNVTCIVEHFLIFDRIKALFAILAVKIAGGEELAALGANVLIKTIERFKAGDFSSTKQDDEKATYAKMLTKAEGEKNRRRKQEIASSLE